MTSYIWGCDTFSFHVRRNRVVIGHSYGIAITEIDLEENVTGMARLEDTI